MIPIDSPNLQRNPLNKTRRLIIQGGNVVSESHNVDGLYTLHSYNFPCCPGTYAMLRDKENMVPDIINTTCPSCYKQYGTLCFCGNLSSKGDIKCKKCHRSVCPTNSNISFMEDDSYEGKIFDDISL